MTNEDNISELTNELNADKKKSNKTREIFRTYRNENEVTVKPNPPPNIEPTPMPTVIFHVDSQSTLNHDIKNDPSNTPGRRTKQVRKMEQSMKASDIDLKNFDIDNEQMELCNIELDKTVNFSSAQLHTLNQ